MDLKLSFRFVLLVLVLVTVLLAGCSEEEPANREENADQQAAQAAPSIPDDEPVAQVASQVEPSVVQVNVEAIQTTPFGTERGEGVGSGVI